MKGATSVWSTSITDLSASASAAQYFNRGTDDDNYCAPMSVRKTSGFEVRPRGVSRSTYDVQRGVK